MLLASPPLDFHLSDSYFVVAHFHYVLFRHDRFATFSGIYFWFPKMTGRMLDEGLGKLHFWLTFIGFHLTFLVQHWLGNQGMLRRYADYLPSDRVHNAEHDLDRRSIGAGPVDAAVPVERLPQLPLRRGRDRRRSVGLRQLAGMGHLSCPPPRHNFTELPCIRSERPAFELHYPHMIERMRAEAHGAAATTDRWANQAHHRSSSPSAVPTAPASRRC